MGRACGLNLMNCYLHQSAHIRWCKKYQTLVGVPTSVSVFTDPDFLVDIVGIERSEENRGQKRGEGRISPSVLILLH